MRKPTKRAEKKSVDTHNGIKTGDTVCLKSGGGVMVVEELRCARMVSLVFWKPSQFGYVNGGEPEFVELPVYCLRKADKPNIMLTDDDFPL